MTYYSTNNPSGKRTTFKDALLEGQPEDYGLFMMSREEVPQLPFGQVREMIGKPYSQIAFEVLNPFLRGVFGDSELREMLKDAYDDSVIPTKVQEVTGRTNIMWLTQGPTYSFKDYAARFFGRSLDRVLGERGLRRLVLVATSGDTGPAIGSALHNLDNVAYVVFYPKDSVSSGQRKQMTTLGGNVHAIAVKGDFDVSQAMSKILLNDKEYARQVFGDSERITSANSISLGRLLPQVVYPFYGFSRMGLDSEEAFVASIPSGNFGDMMGSVLARQMGLPISRIICGVNENTEFPDFLTTGKYVVRGSRESPSSAMDVGHPSNMERLFDFYGGSLFDERNAQGKVVRKGVTRKSPDLEGMRRDIFSFAINTQQHYDTMREVFEQYGIILDPHGAVGWRALELMNLGDFSIPALIYETADPGKFPAHVERAIGITPEIPLRMKQQEEMPERVYPIQSEPLGNKKDGFSLSPEQLQEAKEIIAALPIRR